MSEGSRTSRVLALVQKVVHVAVDRRSGARVAREGARPTFAERAAVRALHATSLFARELARAPFPAATAAQRVALLAMAAELRHAASTVLVGDGEAARDRRTVEGALAEVIHETLALVDAALHADEALARGDARFQVAALGVGGGEGGGDPGGDGRDR